MATHENPTKTERELEAILKGAQQVLAGGKTISFRGQSYDLAGFTTLVQSYLDPYVKIRESRALTRKLLEDRRTNELDASEFVHSMKVTAEGAYGDQSVEYAQFGFSPRKKPADLTPEQKQHKLELMRATRLARHTMGKRQKKNVKGDVSSNGSEAGSPATPPTGPKP